EAESPPPRAFPARLLAPCTDGVGGTTCWPEPFRRLARPPGWVPELCSDGGGGTIALPRPPRTPLTIAENVLCSDTGSWGAGLTTADSPILISPGLRMAPARLGAGATTLTFGPAVADPRRETIPAISGAGATAVACNGPDPRAEGRLESEGGA